MKAMRYLKSYNESAKENLSEIETDIKDILLDLNDEGIESHFDDNYPNGLNIHLLKEFVGQSLSPKDIIIWCEIKDVINRINNYIKDINGCDIKYYMDSYEILFADDETFDMLGNPVKIGPVFGRINTQTGRMRQVKPRSVDPNHSCVRFEMYIKLI